MKWTGKGKYPPEQERMRQRHMAEQEAIRSYQRRLQALKDKIDLYGEEKLTPAERFLVGKHHDFFYPEEG